MLTISKSLLGIAALASVLTACSDATSPAPSTRPFAATARFSGGSTDSTQVSGGGGGGGGGISGGGGGGGGGGSTQTSCGTLSGISAYAITVYTTRTGIGFTGTATNCSTRKEAFEVEVVDLDPDPACTVDFPHFIAAKNTDPGASVFWQVNSTLVPCQGKTHYVQMTLWDTKTGQAVATATASAFL